MPQTATPGSRLEGLDLARFAAFVGMVLVNFHVVVTGGHAPPEGGVGDWPLLLQGRAAAGFVVLAGVGLGLMAQRGGAEQQLWLTLRRAAFLMAIGLANMLVFDADILHYYAVYFVFGALLLPLSSRALLGWVLGLNLAAVAAVLTLDFEAGWVMAELRYTDFWTPQGFVRNLVFNGWHPVVPWLGFLLFGVVLSRLPLAAGRTQLALAAGGVVAMLVASMLSTWLLPLMQAAEPELVDLVKTEPVPAMPLYTVAGLGAACALIGVCAWLGERPSLRRWLRPACLVGRQSLTLYVAHILVGMGVLESLGLIEGGSGQQAVVASFWFVAACVVYALVWSRWFKRGPLEGLMRRLAG